MLQDESGQRPRRSLLYMPTSNSRAMQKAHDLPCDGVILDLEDSVAPELVLESTHEETLAIVPLGVLKDYAV